MRFLFVRFACSTKKIINTSWAASIFSSVTMWNSSPTFTQVKIRDYSFSHNCSSLCNAVHLGIDINLQGRSSEAVRCYFVHNTQAPATCKRCKHKVSGSLLNLCTAQCSQLQSQFFPAFRFVSREIMPFFRTAQMSGQIRSLALLARNFEGYMFYLLVSFLSLLHPPEW